MVSYSESEISSVINCVINHTKLSTWCGTFSSVYTWERMTDLSLVGNCSQAMEGVAGERPANVASMERNSNDPIPEKFVLELKRQDEEGCWESNSSPLLLTYDVQLVELHQ